jgi:hypothetical protein
MKCWAYIQVHPVTREVHLAFTTNPVEDPRDILIQSGGWEEAPVEKEELIILASERICDLLGNTSMRTEVSFPVTDDELNSPEMQTIRDLLRQHFHKETNPCS